MSNKEIFVATGGAGRSAVIGKADTRSTAVSGSLLPAVASAVIEGKTLFLVMSKGKLAGVFNRLGQAYPMKAKKAKCGEAPIATVVEGFKAGDGVYQFQLCGTGITRAKVKALVSLTRGAKFSGPELTMVAESLQLVFTDFYTLEEFNGDLKKASDLPQRLDALARNLNEDKKFLKKNPRFVMGSALLLSDMEAVGEFLANNGSLMLRPCLPPAKPEGKVADEKADKKDKKEKVSKKSKSKDDGKPKSKDSKASKKDKKKKPKK